MYVYLAIIAIHIYSSLTVLDGQMVIIHLAVGGSTVTIEHGIASIQINCLKNSMFICESNPNISRVCFSPLIFFIFIYLLGLAILQVSLRILIHLQKKRIRISNFRFLDFTDSSSIFRGFYQQKEVIKFSKRLDLFDSY